MQEPEWPQLSSYTILREVARGGMGIVYEAEQKSLGRRVALKTLATDRELGPNAELRFLTEARSAASLHHSNIVPVFEVGNEAGTSFYAMQFISGLGLDQVSRRVTEFMDSTKRSVQQDKLTRDDTLAQSLVESLLHSDEDGGPGQLPATQVAGFAEAVTRDATPANDDSHDFEIAEAASPTDSESPSTQTPSLELDSATFRVYARRMADIGRQVALGLEYAHQRGIVHRDIKPSNLILDVNGTVWITDFGLAKNEELDLTQTGNVVGTLRYISPERFDGQCDPRSDIYALGITLYEMLVRQPAFTGSQRARLLEKIRTSPPPKLHSLDARIPRDLETIVEKAIEREPARRYATAAELAEDLERFLENRPIKARAISPVGHLVRWAGRNRLVAALILSVLAVLSGLTIVSAIAANSFRNQAIAEKARADTETLLKENEAQGRRMAENVRDFIVRSYGSPNRDEDGKAITVYEVLRREVKNVMTGYGDDPLTQAVLLQAIGDSFESLSEYSDSIEALQASLAIFEKQLGETDRRTIDAMTSLVDVYVSDQNGQDAIAVAQRAYDLVMANYADDEEYCLAAENSLGAAFFTAADDLAACPIFESVLDRMRRLRGDADENTLDAMYNVIQSYHWLSRKDEERELAEEFLKLSLEVYGSDSLEAAKAKEALAEAFKDEDDPIEALELRQEIYSIRDVRLGEDHSKTLDALKGLANANLRVGNIEEGARLHRIHYDLCVAKFGELHRTTVASASGIALALAKSGDELAAIEWLERALEIGRQIDPEDDPNLLNTKSGLAYYCYTNGRKERSLELYQDIFDNGYANTGFQTTLIKNTLQIVALLQLESRHEDAVKTAELFYDLTTSQPAPAAYELVGANAARAAALYELGDYESAVGYARAAMDVPLAGAGFPRGVVRAKMILGLVLLEGDADEFIDGEKLLEAGYAEYLAELQDISPLAQWVAARTCEQAIAVYESLELESEADRWRNRLSQL